MHAWLEVPSHPKALFRATHNGTRKKLCRLVLGGPSATGGGGGWDREAVGLDLVPCPGRLPSTSLMWAPEVAAAALGGGQDGSSGLAAEGSCLLIIGLFWAVSPPPLSPHRCPEPRPGLGLETVLNRGRRESGLGNEWAGTGRSHQEPTTRPGGLLPQLRAAPSTGRGNTGRGDGSRPFRLWQGSARLRLSRTTRATKASRV